ncbi:hypothetical protein HT746_19195 [Burkholderia pyrrocinia]|uniref:hypothetical protein n=1 Tax=Burkholderia pyrrocinia TaxID=60550 RepID=UPI0015762857|nr:hypothetical protein [Burkholderia pyrrocinia]NTX29228.1 hypothetical protein [Burkholderia pyrrocinia]
MKKIALAVLAFSILNETSFAAVTNTGVLTVSAIKSQVNDGTYFHYHFSGDFGSASACNDSNNWPINSNNPAINQVLQTAYITGVSFKAGIDNTSGCIVTTVELQP